MRLFLYYASHSLLNTLKKMMKTWAVIFVIMIVFGGMIGLFGAMLDKSTDKADNTVTVLETDEDGNPGEEISAAEARDGFLKGLMAEHDLAKENIVDCNQCQQSKSPRGFPLGFLYFVISLYNT